MNFTHFDILPSILFGEIPVQLLLDAWCRSVAFQCADNQPLYDLLIPIYLGDLDKPFQLAKLSYAAVQVKARVAAASKGVFESLTGPRIAVEPGLLHKPPHLAILIDLGTSVAFSTSRHSKVIYEHEAASLSTKKTNASISSHYSSSESPRWAFHARGLTSATYPSLPNFGADNLYRALYERTGDEDEGIGREVVRSAAMKWMDTTTNVLVKE
ncbi:hypothetical protein B0H12DRAFT_1223121 [Mycena haematopus]|nr:hypothetical protein B0H12DRAFT_1223121 [Mycena haematopus]